MWVRALGWEDPLKDSMATHSSIHAWRIPQTEEPGELWSVGFHRVRHNWSNLAYTMHDKTAWRVSSNSWAKKVVFWVLFQVKVVKIAAMTTKDLEYYINLVDKAASFERIDSNFERHSTVDKVLYHSIACFNLSWKTESINVANFTVVLF